MQVRSLDVSKRKPKLYAELADLARGAYVNAYPPFSDFKVGAAVLTWDGRVFVGVNTENTGLNLTVHGEMSSVNSAISAGVLRQAAEAGLDQFTCFKACAVVCETVFEAWPCGHCRDYLCGFGLGMDIVVPHSSGKVLWKQLRRVLPHATAAKKLIKLTRGGKLQLQPQASTRGHGLKWNIDPDGDKKSRNEKLLYAAKEAARNWAYAPYSKRPAGAAILLHDGSVYTGCTVENVGYTLSSQPEQVAVDAAVADGALHRALSAGVHPHDFIKAVAYAPLGQPNTWPSGSMRQCLCEWGLKLDVIVEGTKGQPVSESLGQLLPGAFVPDVLSYWTKAR